MTTPILTRQQETIIKKLYDGWIITKPANVIELANYTYTYTAIRPDKSRQVKITIRTKDIIYLIKNNIIIFKKEKSGWSDYITLILSPEPSIKTK